METTDDWTLIERCRAGSTTAFGPLVRRHEGPALVLAEALLGDPDEAADAVQDAFVRAYRTLHRLERGSGFGPWFRVILRNRCLDGLRAEHRRRRVAVEDAASSQAGRVEATALAALERAELSAEVQTALATLGPAYRQILVLKEMEGMSYAEIAREVGVPSGTVGSRLHHAREALKRALLARATAVEAVS
ncbi:MAG: sigma-70 family RNA polymerase sigma factor [Gemmatimonadota bacterium]